MRKTTLYLPEDLQLRLREAARRLGRPQAELVREALESYLQSRSSRRPSSVGSGSDPGLAARDAEAWLDREWGGR